MDHMAEQLGRPDFWRLVLLSWTVAVGVCVLVGWWWPYYHARRREHFDLDAIGFCTVLSPILPPLWIVALVWAFVGEYRGADAGAAFPVLTKDEGKP
jgi:hypothetical protein